MSFAFRRRRKAALLGLLAALLIGCGRPEPPAPVVRPVPTASSEQVVLYFPHKSKPALVREVRKAERHGEQPEFFAMAQLLQGPQSPEARPLFAADASFGFTGGPDQVAIAAKVLEGDVNLLLTQAAADALVRGKDLLPVYAMVDTLASFERVKSVRFLREGPGSGPLQVAGVDISQPLKPRWDLVQG